jgi:hypothetical protein
MPHDLTRREAEQRVYDLINGVGHTQAELDREHYIDHRVCTLREELVRQAEELTEMYQLGAAAVRGPELVFDPEWVDDVEHVFRDDLLIRTDPKFSPGTPPDG